MCEIVNVGVLFSDIQNSSSIQQGHERRYVEEILNRIAEIIEHHRTKGLALIDLNTWGDAVFATASDVLRLADFALDLRDLFARPIPGTLAETLAIRIALDFVRVPIVDNRITGHRGCIGSKLARAARLEPVTPANSVFATSACANYLADQHAAHVTTDDSPVNPRAILHLHRFPYKVHRPKHSGTLEVFSLHKMRGEPPVIWETMTDSEKGAEAVKKLDAIGPISVDPWLIRNVEERHKSVNDRLAKCKNGEEVRFISITAKSIIHPDPPVPGQSIVKASAVAKAIERGARIRGIVLDPSCEEALFRSEIETPDESNPLKRLLQKHADLVKEIEENQTWKHFRARLPDQLILKATKHGLSFGLWLFHDKAIIEPYHLGKTRRDDLVHMCQFSQFTILRERNIEYDMLEAHFENLWLRSDYLWPHIHGPRRVRKKLPRPSELHEQLEKSLADSTNAPPIQVVHLVSNTLRIGDRLQSSFEAIGGPLELSVETHQARTGEDIKAFLANSGIKQAPFVLVQVHGIEGEEGLLEPVVAGMRRGNLIVYIHRPEELILRFALENRCNYRAAQGNLFTLLSQADAIVLSGECFVDVYQEMVPDVVVTSIPLGFVPKPANEQADLDSRLETGSVQFIGSSTTWGEMRHLENLGDLISAVVAASDGTSKITGYAAGSCHRPRCDLNSFCQRPVAIPVGNQEIIDAYNDGKFQDEEGFRNWLNKKAPGKCIVRARKRRSDNYQMESMPESEKDLCLWENRLIDFNLQLYHEILDDKREPDRRGLPKVEYSGTLHKGAAHEIFVVFDSLAMDDVERDEGFQMIKVPTAGGHIDFQTAAKKIIDLVQSPRDRRSLVLENMKSTAKLGMNEIAYAYYRLFLELMS